MIGLVKILLFCNEDVAGSVLVTVALSKVFKILSPGTGGPLAEGDNCFLLETPVLTVELIGVVGVGITSDIIGVLAVIATPFEGADVVTAVALLPLGDLVGEITDWRVCALLA